MSTISIFTPINVIFKRTDVFKLNCRAFFFILILMFSVSGQEQDNSEGQNQTVAFCDILKDPTNFDQKRVRIKANYRYGIEWSELYCLECRDKGLVWLDFENTFDSLTKSKVRKSIKWSEKGRTVNIIAVGTFHSKGKYGHLGGYPFKFVAEYFESAAVILKDSPVLLPTELKLKATCAISGERLRVQ